MALTRRQKRLYEHKANLWRPVITKAADGKILGESYTLAYSNVSCFFQIQPSVDQVALFGRVEADMIFTLDLVHFDEVQEIDADWVLKNITTVPGGANSQNYGRFWIVRGNPRQISGTRRRHAGKKVVMASSIPEAPAGVS